MFLDFFKKPPFGLDISDYSIEIISLEGSFNDSQLLATGRNILEAGVVEDGKILNKKILKKTLKQTIENPTFGKIKTNKLIFALPESKSFIHIFKLPRDLKKKEELDYIKSQAQQTLPYPLKDLYFDFKIRERRELKEILLVAAPKKIVDDYLNLFKDCQLQPIALEIESESLGRALIKDLKKTTLIVDIGTRTTNFSIFDKGELRFSYSIDTAGNKFTEKLAENLKISFSEAERLKKEIGLNPDVREGKIFLVLQKEIQVIIKEIRKVEEYFQKKENKEINEIILSGGSAMLANLPEYLVENLEKPIVDIDILKRKEYLKEDLGVSPILYAVSLGCALRGLFKNPEKAGINLIK